MDHVKYQCSASCTGCWSCDGGLLVCTVCGGAEDSLPGECPGEKMPPEVAEAVFAGRIDFAGGRWVNLLAPIPFGDLRRIYVQAKQDAGPASSSRALRVFWRRGILRYQTAAQSSARALDREGPGGVA